MKNTITVLLFIFCFSQVYAGKDSSDSMFARYPYKSASWKSKTTIQSPEETVTYEQSVFLKGKKMRTEGKFLNRATNEKENQITIIDENMMYSINPDKKQGMKYSLKSANNPVKTDISVYKCRETAKKTGSEKINGEKCDKYEYTCKTGDIDTNITEFRNSNGFSLRTVSKTDNVVTTVETTELKTNASVSDSKFTPAKDIKFMDMDSMLGKDYKKMMKNAEEFEKNQESGEEAAGNNEDEGDSEEAGQKIMKDMMKGMLGE
jgi:outer membrane lipoprotein-sorting protein